MNHTAELIDVVGRIDNMIESRAETGYEEQKYGDGMWKLGRQGILIDATQVWEQMGTQTMAIHDVTDITEVAQIPILVGYRAGKNRGYSVMSVCTWPYEPGNPHWDTDMIEDWSSVHTVITMVLYMEGGTDQTLKGPMCVFEAAVGDNGELLDLHYMATHHMVTQEMLDEHLLHDGILIPYLLMKVGQGLCEPKDPDPMDLSTEDLPVVVATMVEG